VHTAFGTWPSPISAALVAGQGLRLSAVSVLGDDVYWIEGRPQEAGRNVLVRRTADGSITDLTPTGFNVRTRVHEYGGRAYVVHDGVVYFSNFSDQRLYRTAGSDVVPLTPAGRWFYADPVVDARRRRLVCVREDHTGGGEAVTTLVSVPLDAPGGAGDVIASGYDFYSTPRVSPDGSRLSWICWRHPQMPWDGTELWVADLVERGMLTNARRVAGSASESIYQPGWSPDGRLVFAGDAGGWWTLYFCDVNGADGPTIRPVLRDPPRHAEFGRPEWVFGTATWAFAGPSRIVAAYTRHGRWHLAVVDAVTGAWRDIGGGWQPHDWLTATATHAVLVAGSDTAPDAVVRVDLDSGAVETLRASSTVEVDSGYMSVPHAIDFPSDGRVAHAFYFAPQNVDAATPSHERPPLIVISHGGPTTATIPTLDLRVQFWTSRGFAVVDVNYGGSSGYGREYRERLREQWGVVDVADAVNAARHLVLDGKADPDRLIIRGGSAGGYTTFAALTFYPDVFSAGAGYYGVSDLEALAQDTHKFESRYLDSLVGPYPEMRGRYRARSPIHVVERLSCALILFQGLEDKVVPPNQSQMMADAVRAKGRPVAYLTFEGEQHGFRQADTIVRSLEAELYFYGAVFGFTPADAIEPVEIANLKSDAGRT
jgi:dipeptidyl aminopeptidase/acylaminoacyl peptidase